MTDNLNVALQLLALGMSITFGALFLLWGLMALLTFLTSRGAGEETTGAGDGFMAAMITRLLPERERLGSLTRVDRNIVREALTFANAVGALTCTRPGAIPALPTRTEVEQFMARQGNR